MSWKIVRQIESAQIGKAMVKHQIIGQTKGMRKVLPYQTIPYVEKLIGNIQLEEVEQYHAGYGKLFKWL